MDFFAWSVFASEADINDFNLERKNLRSANTSHCMQNENSMFLKKLPLDQGSYPWKIVLAECE